MNVTIYDSPQVFDALEAEWNDLLARSYTHTLFGTWEWQKHWWDAYQEGMLFVLAFRGEDRQLLGIAPFFIAPEGDLRVLKLVGTEDVTDYLDLLIDREQATSVLNCLAETLFAHRQHYDALRLCNIPDGSPTLAVLADFLGAYDMSVTITPHEVCPIIPLPTTYEAYFDMLDSKQARELRRKLRRAEGSGDMSWYIVGEAHDIHTELETFLHLMARSHPEKAKFLQDPRHVAFFKAFMPVAYAKGWLQLNFETVLDEPVASYLNFDYGGEILVYNSGLEPNKYGALSPGIVLLAHNIEHAIVQGRRAFNFLRGNENYKYLMGAQDTTIYQLLATV
jgi:CelD/BcsL family acetyltransferase involved in cellulose biosynthesis